MKETVSENKIGSAAGGEEYPVSENNFDNGGNTTAKESCEAKGRRIRGKNADKDKSDIKKRKENIAARSSKEIALMGATVALLLAGQFVLSGVQGVEVVTVFLLSFCVAFGVRRGMVVATVFSLIRNFIYGFYLNVIILYLVYYNFFALTFGFTGKFIKNLPVWAEITVLSAAAGIITCCFTLLDDIITPYLYGYTAKSAAVYFYASLPVMGVQAACAVITVALLWFPLSKAFSLIKL